MLYRIMQDRLKGCAFLVFELIAFIANIITILEWIERLLHPFSDDHFVSQVFFLEYHPIGAGLIMTCGLTGISLFVWLFLSERIIGEIQAGVYAFVLYIFPSSLVIYSYVNTYFKPDFMDILFSKTTIFAFILLPYLVGKILMDILLSPTRNSH